MRDIRGYEIPEVETTSNRSKLLGAAVVALGLGALGAYAFASGDSASSASQQMASNQIRTTPDRYQAQQMPPPVSPTRSENLAVNTTKPVVPPSSAPEATKTPLDGTPLDPGTKSKPVKEKSESSQEAAVQPKTPAASPNKPDMTPPENVQPAPQAQPAATPDQQAPQETPAPTQNTTPPQGQ